MGVGTRVWERFGHNAILVDDRQRGTRTAYNYGLFDFRQEDFLLRFIQGRMWYWMQGLDADAMVRSYVRDNRSVWVQELDLSPEERLALRDFLVWNERPENRHYRYDYYRDNCSTRVRDALDRVLNGRLRARTDSVATGTTYRFHTKRLTARTFRSTPASLSPSARRWTGRSARGRRCSFRSPFVSGRGA